eukprot:659141-Prorocentrum_minimum.AAC.1
MHYLYLFWGRRYAVLLEEVEGGGGLRAEVTRLRELNSTLRGRSEELSSNKQDADLLNSQVTKLTLEVARLVRPGPLSANISLKYTPPIGQDYAVEYRALIGTEVVDSGSEVPMCLTLPCCCPYCQPQTAGPVRDSTLQRSRRRYSALCRLAVGCESYLYGPAYKAWRGTKEKQGMVELNQKQAEALAKKSWEKQQLSAELAVIKGDASALARVPPNFVGLNGQVRLST